MSTLPTVLISLCLLVVVLALVAAFTGRRWSPAAAYLPLLSIHFIPGLHLDPGESLIFWGLAAAIACGINYLLPRELSTGTVGNGYLCGAALTGAFVGMLVSTAGIVLGAAAGALLGGIAFSRTPAGHVMRFPSREFFNYLCAKGLPVTVVVSLAVISIMSIYTEVTLY